MKGKRKMMGSVHQKKPGTHFRRKEEGGEKRSNAAASWKNS